MVKATSFTGALRAIIAARSVGLAPSGVGAADLSPDVEVDSVRVEMPPPMPVFSWAGFTADLHLGGSSKAARRRCGRRRTLRPSSTPTRGVIGGVHVGYNHQMIRLIDGQALVLGLDANVVGANGPGSRSDGPPSGATLSTTFDMEGAIRARAGLPLNRVLLYAIDDASFAGLTTRVRTAFTEESAIDASSHARAGFTLGGGVDYAFMS